jgi:hypothetical protein
VPTVWLMLLQHLEETGKPLPYLKRVVIGGSACPPAMTRAFQEDFGVEVLHAWGMTEMSPLGTVCTFKPKHLKEGKEERYALQNKQGRAIYGVDLKVVGEDGAELPWDGKNIGELHVRGPWVIRSYFKGEGGDPLKGGWFPTGDVVNIDPEGYIQITDRSKDVIKSGGEWISSIDLENIAIAHPAIAEAAVIGVRHPKWDERPIVVAVKKPGQEVSKDELLRFYEGKIAKWWMPDDVVFVDIRDVQVIKDDRTFLITDRFGDVPEGNTAALGLYHMDTRFLSGLELVVNDMKPLLLHSSTERNYSQIVEVTYPFEAIDTEGVHRKENVSIQRFRVLSDGSLHERIRVRNFGTKPRRITMTVEFDADFRDLFEIRGLVRDRRGQQQAPRVDRSTVVLSYRGLDGEVRTTTIRFSPAPL